MKLIILALGATLLTIGVTFGQIGETLQQCMAKYGRLLRNSRETGTSS
jgi:hypothetical protein